MKCIYCLAGDLKSTGDFPPGLGGMKVYQVSSGEISALISDVNLDHVVNNAQNATVHHEVVQATLELSASVIPCRFGTLVHNEEEILSLLRVRSAWLDACLTRIRGKVEVGVAAIVDGMTSPVLRRWETEGKGQSMTTGERYLLEKRQRYEVTKILRGQAECLSRKLNEATTPLWAEIKVEQRFIGYKLLLNLCYLIDRGKLSSFHYTYQQFKKRWPGVKLLYTGPWPPYSFTEFSLFSS
ncbi:MAG: GvpL/GvpF family gas vesicle protein [Candidatus Latescibacteria bacterium]|nr:GvpL/GvpF family gas vesicle protein [Candidatus Latescibacterota bacterium]